MQIPISQYPNIRAYRDIGIPGYRDIGISGYRDIGMLGYRDIGISGYRDIGISGYLFFSLGTEPCSRLFYWCSGEAHLPAISSALPCLSFLYLSFAPVATNWVT